MVKHDEGHLSHRIGLLRAMVLGANDGIISTACLILGVAAADATRSTIITAGVAGLVAGAASMAIGEYVSVSSTLCLVGIFGQRQQRIDTKPTQWLNLPLF